MTRKKQNIDPDNILVVGVDIGYGDTNVVWAHGRDKFPSIAGHAEEITYQAERITQRYPAMQLSDDSGDWFIGDLAANHLTDGKIDRLTGRSPDEITRGFPHRLRLLKVALAKAIRHEIDEGYLSAKSGDMIQVYLSTGLPVNHFQKTAPRLQEFLIGQHKIITDAGSYVVNIQHIEILPEPYGCIYANQILPSGELNPHFTHKKIAVVNIGTVTIDVYGDDNGDPMNHIKGSVEGGLSNAKAELFNYLDMKYGEPPRYEMVEYALRHKSVNVPGDPSCDKDGYVRIEKQWDDALAPVQTATIRLMNDKIKVGDYLDAIILTGGGALPVYPKVHIQYRRAQVSNDPEFDTAQGYYNILRMDIRDGDVVLV